MTERKLFPYIWARAQCTRPMTNIFEPPIEADGIFINNETLVAGSSQKKNQQIATRAQAFPELDALAKPILEANSIQMHGFGGLGEMILYLTSDQIKSGEVGVFEQLDTYKGHYDGSNDFVLLPAQVTKIQAVADWAALRRDSLRNYMVFANLSDSQMHRETTMKVYSELLEPFGLKRG